MQLTTLGGLRVAGATFVRPKPLLLAAYVALEGPRDRRHLAELFWQGAADPLNSLAAALKQLRQGAQGLVEADMHRVWTPLSCDAVTFLQNVEAGRYEAGLNLYHGPFLKDAYLPGWGAELEEWVYTTREFLAARARTALLRLAEWEAAEGRFEKAARRAETAYLLAGAPEPEQEELTRFHRLLAAGGSSQLARLCKDAQSMGLDLSLTLADACKRLQKAPLHLPTPVTSFVGRDAESLEIAQTLAQTECSLLTLTGPGGVGKSRLALQVAHDVVGRYPGGVYYAALESLTSPTLVPTSLAEALDLSLNGSEDPLVQLARHLGDRSVLLVLDNYEHLVDGATLLSELLGRCPKLELLVTSRERLNVQEEWVFPVDGLPLAPPDTPLAEAPDYDAVKLFAQRAKRSRLSFELTPETLPHVVCICQQVQGLPLGLELAAAWVIHLSCREIGEEIAQTLDFLTSPNRNAAERHRSLRAVFEHSWKFLAPQEREVLRKLSVFRGGFSRKAAAEVTGATIPVLASLVDKSLLRFFPSGRYSCHPLLYEYAQEKLAEHPAERAQAKAAHGNLYFRFLHARKVEMNSGAQREGLEATAKELENIRAAWGWAVAELRVEMLQGAVEPLTLFYDRQARYAEGIELFGAALTGLSEADPNHHLALGNALIGQAFLYQWSSNYPQAVKLAQRGLVLLRPLGESWGIMVGIDTLGFVSAFTGDFAEGKRCWTEALALAKAQDNLVKTAELLSIMGMTEYWQGNQAEAEAYLDEAMVLTPPLGKHTAVIYILLNLGFVNILDDPEKAQLAFQQGLQLTRELGYRRHLPYLLYGLGWAFCLLGRYPEAQTFCKQAVEVAQESGNLFAKSMALTVLGRATAALHDYSQAQDYFEQSLRLSKLTQSMFSLTVTLAYLAALWIEQEKTEQAAELLGLVLHQLTAISFARVIAERLVTELQDKLSAAVLAAALERGKRMRLEEVVARILREPPLELHGAEDVACK